MIIIIKIMIIYQGIFTFSKSATETLEHDVKFVQS